MFYFLSHTHVLFKNTHWKNIPPWTNAQRQYHNKILLEQRTRPRISNTRQTTDQPILKWRGNLHEKLYKNNFDAIDVPPFPKKRAKLNTISPVYTYLTVFLPWTFYLFCTETINYFQPAPKWRSNNTEWSLNH